jgi:hypothetical protein
LVTLKTLKDVIVVAVVPDLVLVDVVDVVDLVVKVDVVDLLSNLFLKRTASKAVFFIIFVK